MNKKTRNVLSGILVGIASLAAIINFADIPAGDVGRFLLSTAIFLICIVLLALLAVSIFKLLGWVKKRASGETDDDGSGPGFYEEPGESEEKNDRA